MPGALVRGSCTKGAVDQHAKRILEGEDSQASFLMGDI